MDSDDKKAYRFIKLPQTKYRKEANFILAVGLLLVFIGLFVLVGNQEKATKIFAFRPVLSLSSGIILLFIALALTGESFSVFLGCFFVLMGVVFLLVDSHIIPYSFSEMWPTIMIASGLALFPAGLYRAKRIRTVYLFPAIMLVLLGICFLLFSLRVFPIPFRVFVSRFWPLLIIICGLGLVVMFFVQQVNSKTFPYMEDDSLVDGDEK